MLAEIRALELICFGGLNVPSVVLNMSYLLLTPVDFNQRELSEKGAVSSGGSTPRNGSHRPVFA